MALDLVIANSGSSNISVLLGNGNGTFGVQKTYACGSSPSSVALGDVNGDGLLDAVVANQLSSTVSVLLGNGDGFFQTQTTFKTGTGSEVYEIALADLNGDGKLDIVGADYTGPSVVVLLGNGTGTFAAPHSYSLPSPAYSLLTADLNGDGKQDVVVQTLAAIDTLLGNGNGTFQAARTILATGNAHCFCAVADVNGDLVMDLAVAISGASPRVAILLGNNNGTFQAPTTIGLTANPNFVLLSDINGDRKADLVTDDSNQITYVFLGNGNGTFQAKQTFSQSGVNWGQGVLADFDGDGKPDLARVSGGSFKQTIAYLGNGNGTFKAGTTFATGTTPVALATAQLKIPTPSALPVSLTGIYTPNLTMTGVLELSMTLTGTNQQSISMTGVF